MNNSALNNAIQVVRVMSADDNARYVAEMREKAEYDYYAGLASAREKGIAEGRKERDAELIAKMRALGHTEEEIRELFGNN